MPYTKIKAGLIKESIARHFEIEETFVDISVVDSNTEKKKYGCSIQLETTENKLKAFHLSLYSFYLEAEDETGFWYENTYYSYVQIDIFLDRLEKQIKEINNQ